MAYASLGGFALDWVPDQYSHGACARVITHKTIGGGRTYDVLYDDPEDIEVAGKLVGPTRYASRDALSAMAGTIQTLIIGQDTIQVVVLAVRFGEEWGVIGYRAALSVLNTAPPSSTSSPIVSTANAVSQANSVTLVTPSQTLQASLTAAQSGLVGATDPSVVSGSLTAAVTAASNVVATNDAILATSPIQTGQTMPAAVFAAAMSAQANAASDRYYASTILAQLQIAQSASGAA